MTSDCFRGCGTHFTAHCRYTIRSTCTIGSTWRFLLRNYAHA